LLRADLFSLIAYSRARGLRAVLSANGTLITEEVAVRLKALGLAYVGVSLDGLAENNDCFRGVPGAFTRALQGIIHCREAGLKVGLRFTMHRSNIGDLPGIFALLQRERIPRVCFYHLVYSGRGSSLQAEDLLPEETRGAVDLIIDHTRDLHAAGFPLEVLTVDNHCDGPYLYMRLLREDPARAARALSLLERNGGNSSGIGIGCVSWDGSVYADQFWRHAPLGNVRDRSFGEIWTDISNPFLAQLKARKPLLTGRCAACKWLNICNGNFRVRAEAVTGDRWAPDPACYLTDEEIGV
jgi:radical SAM protein with 4Fe4S-binding SPASM domain